MRKFGWWTTGRDAAALDLFETVYRAAADGTIPGEISYVFCSRERGEGRWSDALADRAGGFGIPVVTYSARGHLPELRRADRERWRESYHHEVLRRIEGFDADVTVLAGYMWVVSAEVCRRLSIINLHPAAPGGPAGTWQEVIWQLLADRAGRTGVMMHLVTPELDRGPAVTCCTFAIRGPAWESLWDEFEEAVRRRGIEAVKASEGESQALFAAIRREGMRRELPLIVQTLRAFAKGEISILEGRLFDASGKRLVGPHDLTGPIEAALER